MGGDYTHTHIHTCTHAHTIHTRVCETDMEIKRARELFFLKVLPGAFYATKSILRSNTRWVRSSSVGEIVHTTPPQEIISYICADILSISLM